MDERDVHALWDDYYAYALKKTPSHIWQIQHAN